MTAPTTTALDRLTDVLRDRDCKPRPSTGGQWSARCPAHKDNHPSLSLRQTEQQALVYCHAGCATRDVLAALSLELADLYDDRKGANYRYDDGRIVHRSPDKKFRQSNTEGRPSLYRLGKIREAVAAGQTVHVCEGEKDVHALESVGLVATTSPMGAGKWSKVDPSPLAKANVVIVADNDEPGRKHAAEVKASLDQLAAVVTVVTAKTGKDAADHIAAGYGPEEFVPVEIAAATVSTKPGPWDPVNVRDVVAGLLAGTLSRPTPTVGLRGDLAGLFYPGMVNGLQGTSGCGKTWTALYTCAQEVAAGRHVFYIDYESDAPVTIGRMLELGADPQAVGDYFHYRNPDVRLDPDAAAKLFADVANVQPSVAIIDSTGESMAVEGDRPNDDDDTARWFRRLASPIAKLGPATVVLDHMTKADEAALYPTGSHRKRGAITGASYTQITVEEFARGKPGSAKLVCSKDRHGTYSRGQKVATLKARPTEDGLRLTLDAPPEQAGGDGKPFRPTLLMERISRELEAADAVLSQAEIDQRVKGKQEPKLKALDRLVIEGYVERSTGPRNAKLHRLAKPYRQAADPDSESYEGEGEGHLLPDPLSTSSTFSLLGEGEGEKVDDLPPEKIGRRWEKVEKVEKESPESPSHLAARRAAVAGWTGEDFRANGQALREQYAEPRGRGQL